MQLPITLFAGIDVGASRTKAVIMSPERKILGYSVRKSGVDFSRTVNRCFQSSLDMAGIKTGESIKTFSTGYGRLNVSFRQGTKTEISCHARACYFYFQTAMTIVDIGGQDNKIIKLDADGKRSSFKMNRKCAAGTGAFLEEMSMRLDIPIENMNKLAERSTEIVELGSYCTVFSATEVLEKIRQGKKVPDIIKGLFLSVIKRVMEMDALTEQVVMTGGVVAHNPFMVSMVEELIGRKVLVPEHPQLTGAVGAALYAMES
jgi:predicted CoA-substrate-specific enzyme activase